MKKYGLHILVLGVTVAALTVGLSVYLTARIAPVIFILLVIAAIVQQVRARRSPRKVPTIQLDASGFSLTSKTGLPLWAVRWEEIDSVDAFQLDCITTDLICAAFYTSEGSISWTRSASEGRTHDRDVLETARGQTVRRCFSRNCRSRVQNK